MTILEIKDQLQKNSTAKFSFKDKQKREFNACMYYLKQRDEYIVEVYGLSGHHTAADFHFQNHNIELQEIVVAEEEKKNGGDEFVPELKNIGGQAETIDGPNVEFNSELTQEQIDALNESQNEENIGNDLKNTSPEAPVLNPVELPPVKNKKTGKKKGK